MTRLVPQREGIPLPHPSPTSAPFWEGCNEGRLLFQRCGSCGGIVFEPAPLCRRCNGRDLHWEQSGGLGTVYSWTVAHRPQMAAFTVPYAPVIVDLDEGYQLLTNLIECDSDAIQVGMRVRVDFRDIGGQKLPYFRPV